MEVSRPNRYYFTSKKVDATTKLRKQIKKFMPDNRRNECRNMSKSQHCHGKKIHKIEYFNNKKAQGELFAFG